MTFSRSMVAGLAALIFTVSLAASSSSLRAQTTLDPASRPAEPKPGSFFQSPATQAQQADDGANPAMLWVGQGEKLWSSSGGSDTKSCAGCHGDATQTMKGVAARYPQIDAKTGALLNLEARINQCRIDRQHATAYDYESAPLLSLTAYVTLQSRGMPRDVKIDGAAAAQFEAGRSFFVTRQGQLNLACGQCHDQSVGQKLRGDTISQGQSGGWPAYRFEWQTMGSLHRRLRACSLGVRAEQLPYGSPEYVALELYLAWRSQGLLLDAPGVRR